MNAQHKKTRSSACNFEVIENQGKEKNFRGSLRGDKKAKQNKKSPYIEEQRKE